MIAYNQVDSTQVLPQVSDLPIDPDVTMGLLDNGIRYYIRHNKKPEKRAELRLAVRAGSMQEDDEQQGLAHFVEHMAFNGTTHFKKNELIDYLEMVGMKFGPDLNAYTSFDQTVYMLQARTDSLDLLQKGLLILEDWATGLSFSEEEIDKERGVVLSEWRSSLSPDQRIYNEYLPVLYQGSRYAKRLPIGKPEIVEHADYETVRRFYRDWYRPDLMVIIAVGDFDVAMMEEEIKKRFSKIPTTPQARKRETYHVPSHEETLVKVVGDTEASFTRVHLYHKHPHESNRTLESFRDAIVRSIYNRMLSVRLEELTKQAKPPFTFGYSGYSPDLGDIDTYESYAFVAEGGSLKGLEALLEENERVKKHGFTNTELARVKTDLLKNMERGVKEKDKMPSKQLANAYLYHFLKDNPIPSIEQRQQLYETFLPTIQLEEVNQLAQKWIRTQNRVVVISGPEKESSPLPTEVAIRRVLEEVSKKEMTPYVDEVNDAPILSEKLYPVAVSNQKAYPEFGLTEFTLANGIRVVLKPTDFKNDEILMESFSPGGNSLYDDNLYQSASAATTITQEAGIGDFDGIALDKKLTGKNVSVYPYIGELFEGINGNCSPDDLETMMKMVYLYFTSPRKDEDAVQSYVAKQKSIFKNLMSNPQYYFYDQTSRIKYNSHVRRTWPTAKQLESINVDDVYQVYTDRFSNASDFTFVFVGNFEVEAMKKMLATYLGNLPSEKRKETFKDLGINLAKGQVVKQFVRGETPKSLVELTFHDSAFDYSDENILIFYSMINILRIKMRESMREDKGGVYGVNINGSIRKYPNPAYSITIAFNSEPDRVEDLIATALQDIETAKQIGAEEKDLIKVKAARLQDRKKSLKENRWWLGDLAKNYRNAAADFGLLDYEAYENAVNNITAEDIKKATQQYFNTENFIKIVMTPGN